MKLANVDIAVDTRPPALLLAIAIALSAATAFAENTESAADKPADALAEQLTPMIENHRGEVAVAVEHLDSGQSFEYRADEPMSTASLIKFPLMIATYKALEDGEFDLATMIELQEDDKVPGSGILTANFSAGTKISLRDAIHLMIVFSDNTATNLVIDQVGLPATAELMGKLSCPETRLHSKVYRRNTSIFPDRSPKFGLGSTTAADMVKLLGQVHAGELVSEDASKKMYAHLLDCNDRTKIARKLPGDVKFAHKTGSVSNVRTDAGIMETPAGAIAVCVLTDKNEDKSWSDDNEAELLCGEIGAAVYRHFNADEPAQAPKVARVLKMGGNGRLVESLQRTLNARLEPSPELQVDGDFGPATEAAVIRFQQASKLEANGVVKPEVWQALGPLVTSDEIVPEPADVNAEIAERSPPDSLHGQPFVTAKAWAIADGETGQVLWGYNDSARRDPASVTKIMTAFLVARLAEDDPDVLEETVTFSQRADETSGSTSALRAGEQVPVSDLLYGLLLPSGNDASVALGEHFGPRLAQATGEGDEDADPYRQFVAAMNRTAKELGMHETHYENTHGLTHKDHETSARDMVKLAHAAMQMPLIRERVATAKYGCKVTSLAGYERNVVWRNTNRLLGIEGYDGVKTGTTGAAGACLVSRGNRDGSKLILVVLGSSSSDARYADSRNLYRWAWQQLKSAK